MPLDQISNTVIDIGKTFEALFGYRPAVIPSMPAQPNAADPYNVDTAAAVRYRAQVGGLTPLYNNNIADMIGRPVFMPITLITNGPLQVVVNLPFSLVSLRNRLLIKETPMVERGGSVIEQTGVGPWEMEIKGFLIDGNDQFPDDQLVQLNQLYTANQSAGTISTVALKCTLTDIFLGANPQVVITELEIPMKAKVIGVRDFSMRLIQDSILTLYPSTTTATTPIDPAIAAALPING